MSNGVERPLADLSEERAETRVASTGGSQHHGIDEVPQDAGKFALSSPRSGEPNDDFLLSRVPVQESLKSSQQRDEKRRAFRGCHRFEPRSQFRAKLEPQGRPL